MQTRDSGGDSGRSRPRSVRPPSGGARPSTPASAAVRHPGDTFPSGGAAGPSPGPHSRPRPATGAARDSGRPCRPQCVATGGTWPTPRPRARAPWPPHAERRRGPGHAGGDPSSQQGEGVCGHGASSPQRRRGPPVFGGLHCLGLNDRRRRVGLAPHGRATLGAQWLVEAEPGAVRLPGADALIGGLPVRQIVGHQAPGAAAPPHLVKAMHDLSQGVLAGATPSLFGRQEGGQHLPLLVGAIRGVSQASGGHGRVSSRAQDRSCTEAAQRL